MDNEFEGRTTVAGRKCLGFSYWTDCGYEYDCEYLADFDCSECVFVVGYYEKDYRKGKRPWAKGAEECSLK